jgi:endonuclease/exonuclease/phosphatase family metal-dependent hydrolase
MTPSPMASAAGMTLRIATWNLWAIGPSWIDRVGRAADVLDALRADVVALQEVRRDAGHDAGSSLAGSLGLHLGRGDAVGASWWSRRVGTEIAVDNVVLSRWPVSETIVQVLPHRSDSDERRSALHLRIEAPVPLRVVSTQLASSPLECELRVAQVRALAGDLAGRRRNDEVVLVAGDMNAEPDSDEMRLLGGHKTAPPSPGHVLLDLWRFAPDGARSATWDRTNPHVAATNEPSCRIDYLYAAPMPSGRLPGVTSIERFGTARVGEVWPSDHAGVVADLELDRP